MIAAALLADLPVEQRLALAYARGQSAAPLGALLCLDARAAAIVRNAREPLFGQLRLAWWRERLADLPGADPAAEPLLALLRDWPADRRLLTDLIDAWEAVLAADQLDLPQVEQLAGARAAGFAALAGDDRAPAVLSAARGWAFADLCARLVDPDGSQAALAAAATHDWRPLRLPGTLRPLAVLYALARHSHQGMPLMPGWTAMVRAIRVGIAGR